MNKEYVPTNGIVEPDFLEYIKKTFKHWNKLYENGITLGSREIAKFKSTVYGAKLNARFGFEAVTHRGLDEEGQEWFALLIYKNREAVDIEMPLYKFRTKLKSNEKYTDKSRGTR